MKRFTDTEKWTDERFQALSSDLKLLLLYIFDNCDKCGFWRPELDVFKIRSGCQVAGKTLPEQLAWAIHPHPAGPWQIKCFFPDQYPDQDEQTKNGLAKSAFKELARWATKLGTTNDVFFIAGLRRVPSAGKSLSGTIPARVPQGDVDVDGAVDVDGVEKDEFEVEGPGGGVPSGRGHEFDLGVASMRLEAQSAGKTWPRRLRRDLSISLEDAFKAHGVERVAKGWGRYLQGFKGGQSLRNYLDVRYTDRWMNDVPLTKAPCEHVPRVASERPELAEFPLGVKLKRLECGKCKVHLRDVREYPECSHSVMVPVPLPAGAEPMVQCQACGMSRPSLEEAA